MIVKRWEEFQVGPKDVSSELHVTLNPKGEIVIGAAAFERFGRPGQAVLLYEPEHKFIGLAPASTVAKNAYPLQAPKNEKHRHRILRASRFCKAHGITVPATMAFNKAEIDEEGVLVLPLQNMRVVGKKKE
ncbi:MAG: hypothetical protein IPL32_06530 [Chloracidobacterium sp.]|nr:hypothetical protein [Chloracidobacterium sp.]